MAEIKARLFELSKFLTSGEYNVAKLNEVLGGMQCEAKPFPTDSYIKVSCPGWVTIAVTPLAVLLTMDHMGWKVWSKPVGCTVLTRLHGRIDNV